MIAEIYNFKTKEQFDEFVSAVGKISESDRTSPFEVDYSAERMIVWIKCTDRDKLHKKCVWFLHNCDPLKTTVYRTVRL